MELPEILINYVLEKECEILSEDIVGIYQYGSRVYGSASKNSDWDFVVITRTANPYVEISTHNLDIHIMDIDTYIYKLKEHDIMALEIYYTNTQGLPIKSFNVDFTLDLQKLRKSVSSVSSNSFVKFKKKLTIPEEDNYIGIKSLFHSIRIVQMGYRIATGSKNVLYTDTYLWERIQNDANKYNYDWQKLHDIYKPLLNEETTEFRTVAPKA